MGVTVTYVSFSAMDEVTQREARRRLADLVRREGGPTAFARKVGMTKGHISGLMNGKSFGPLAQVNIERAYNLRSGYFDGRDASEDGDAAVHWLPIKDIEHAAKPAQPGARQLPLVMPVSAKAFAVLMQSDAMMATSPGERSIPPGVYVIVDPDRPFARGDDVLAELRPDTPPVVRRVLQDGEFFYLRSINPSYPELAKIWKGVTVLGRVMGIVAAY